MIPFEILYTLFLGLIKYSLQGIFEYGSSKETECSSSSQMKGLNTVEFERRMRMLSPLSKCQSDWFMPRASFNTGVTTLAGIQGQEMVGLCLLTIVCLPGMLDDLHVEKQHMHLL